MRMNLDRSSKARSFVAARAVAFAAWAGVALLTSAGSAHAQVARSTMIQVAPSVLKIEAVSPDGHYQLGSGVIVARGKVVTNCHVTRKAQRIQVIRGGQRWTVSRQAADMLKDLCVLEVPRLEGEPVLLGRADSLKMAQDVVAIGYTGGVGVQLSDGDVVALHPWSGSQIIQSSNWFSSGASGGGLFNGEGALVGVLTFRLRGGAAHYFAAPVEWLNGLADVDSRFAPVEPLSGQSYWELPAGAQPFFLQAAAFEQNQDWASLSQLAQRWSGEDRQDPEAQYIQGVAQEGLGNVDASIQAFKASLDLDATYSRSWARLAQIYKKQGQMRNARQAIAQLAVLDPKQASELAAQLEKP